MALFGKYDYNKAGKGIAKNAPKKKTFFAFLELYFRYAWRLMKLNVVTFIFCIPIVTIGPALAGMTKVLRNYTLDKSAFIFHEFWKGFSNNWKQSLPVGLLDILFAVSAVTAFQVYPKMGEQAVAAGGSSTPYTILCVISISFALTLLMMNFYIMPMIVATDLSLKNIIKNGFFLTCVCLKKNVFTLLIIALITAFMIIAPDMAMLLVPFWAISFMGFVIMYNSYPQIQKYVINPYYEERGMDNPEYDYLKPLAIEDSIFTDRGGEEAPIDGKKKKKGKIIS
ncbi:MAG: YesL family protein [Oscillospiraceae bacterium]|nr:YesL family protein [Oscillospiraceae bacterium]